jgi:uncharacterized DUF497 family protein
MEHGTRNTKCASRALTAGKCQLLVRFSRFSFSDKSSIMGPVNVWLVVAYPMSCMLAHKDTPATKLHVNSLRWTAASVRGVSMVDWHRFIPSDFEYDFEKDKLVAHGITFEEAVKCFFSDFQVRRNKSYRDRYQLIGRTLGGRRLKIIFQLKPNRVVRIITGWQV